MLIERERFDVFLTGDKNMRDQQRLEDRPFAVLVMSAINWPVVRPMLTRSLQRSTKHGTVDTIDCGVPRSTSQTYFERDRISAAPKEIQLRKNAGAAVPKFLRPWIQPQPHSLQAKAES